jgi:hypothetical protein
MPEISALAIDFAKRSFRVCATTREDVVIFNRSFTRTPHTDLQECWAERSFRLASYLSSWAGLSCLPAMR